jgi:hypothetical protein
MRFRDNPEYRDMIKGNYYKLDHYIDKLNNLAGFGPISSPWKTSLRSETLDSLSAVAADRYLDSLGRHFNALRKVNQQRNDSVAKKIGEEKLTMLRERYENGKLKEYMLDELNKNKSIETHDKIIQKYTPVYMKPVSRYGRAQFYAPYKQLGELKISTFWFNIAVLWLATVLMYLALYYAVLQRVIEYFGSLPVPFRRK